MPHSPNIYDERSNNLDFVRLSLAVVVIFSHSFATLGMDKKEPLMVLTSGEANLGAAAVDAFFIVSGFLIANSFVHSRSLWQYFKKRILRIYPAFIVAMLFCYFVVLPLSGGHSEYPTLGRRVADFALRSLTLFQFHQQGAFPGNPLSALNASIWSIPYEFACYVGLAFLGTLGLLRRRWVMFSLAISSLFLWLLLFSATGATAFSGGWLARHSHTLTVMTVVRGFHIPMIFMRIRLVGVYLVGVVFYLFRKQIPHRTSWALGAALLLGLSCLVPLGWSFSSPVLGGYLIFWFAFHPSIPLNHFGRYGDFSYGTYLYAFPIQQLLIRYLGVGMGPSKVFLLATPLSLLIASLSWHGVEKWFLARTKRITVPLKAPEPVH